MNILKNLFLFSKKTKKNKDFIPGFDQYTEIAKLVKEARIQQNITQKNCRVFQKFLNE